MRPPAPRMETINEGHQHDHPGAAYCRRPELGPDWPVRLRPCRGDFRRDVGPQPDRLHAGRGVGAVAARAFVHRQPRLTRCGAGTLLSAPLQAWWIAFTTW